MNDNAGGTPTTETTAPARSQMRVLAQSRPGLLLLGAWWLLLVAAVDGTLLLVPWAVRGWDVEPLHVAPRAGLVAAVLGVGLIALCAKIAGRRAVVGLVGLVLGVALMAFVVRPAIAAGVPAPVATLVVGLAITFLTLGLTYGLRAVSIAGAVAMSVGLIATTLLAWPVVALVAPGNAVAIAGIGLATLGALCDVVITQVSTVVVAARQTGRRRLDHTTLAAIARDSLEVGGDHLTSMIHTLSLAFLSPAVLSFGVTDISMDMLVAVIGGIAVAAVTWLTTTLAVAAIRGLTPADLRELSVEDH